MKIDRTYQIKYQTDWVSVGNQQYERNENLLTGEIHWYLRSGIVRVRPVSQNCFAHLEKEFQAVAV